MTRTTRCARPLRPAFGLVGPALLLGILLAHPPAGAQPAPFNGPRQVDPRWHALTGATLVSAPGERIENATVVLRDGLIASVSAGGAPPEGARVWDCAGLTIYAGLIDAHVPVDATKPDSGSPVAGAHWRSNVTPERSALDGKGADDKLRRELRSLGFGAAALSPRGGVFRGQGAVVLLDDPGQPGIGGVVTSGTGDQAPGAAGGNALPATSVRASVLRTGVYHETALEAQGFGSRSSTEGFTGPASEMGAIAIVRQTLLDADWHARRFEAGSGGEPVPRHAALEALGRGGKGGAPLLFDTSDELQAIRVAKIAREFDRPHLLLGSGLEFRRLAPIVEDGGAIILPLSYPDAPKVASPSDAESIGLRELMTWEQAPTNPRRLARAGATIALTSDKLRKRTDFWPHVRKAVEHGLTEDEVLAALTTTPAKLLGVGDRVGRVAPGMVANLLITDGPLTGEKTRVRDVWVAGRRFEITAPSAGEAFEGTWDATYRTDPPFDGQLVIGKQDSVTAKAMDKEGKARSVATREDRISFVLDNEPWGGEGSMTLAAVRTGDTLLGQATNSDGSRFAWSATRRTGEPAKEDAEKEEDAEAPDAADARPQGERQARKPKKKAEPPPEELPTPFGPYGLYEKPERTAVLVTGATVWTSGPHGVIQNGAVLIGADGKFAYVGPASGAPTPWGARVIDAKGRHVTPGLIDCHSHTAISSGVNDYPEAVTAEVRIGDVLDPEDIAIYRQLAGGLTAANQLHGSANAIGGQNAVSKWRWGVARPDDMKLDGAPAGIKFALGENPRAANSDGPNARQRYPQTRMGVEALIRDRFTAARDYTAQVKSGAARRDLELDAIAEILDGTRLVHCHSYRQDEILMLCRIADEFGFQIGTFQHVLEGYKVAEAIKKSAIGGSCFSDWWAYKFEVYDAIPEDGAIMHEVGVTVSFNSDSDELARRMNAEAAKAVKYGGLAPEEALKFVTINPAKQLKVDSMIGSLEVGKHGDLVVWSGDPLSATSRCEATFVDGVEMFSLEQDRAHRERNAKDRARIVQKALAEAPKRGGRDGEGPGGGGRPGERLSLAERYEAEARERHYLGLMRAGIDPDQHMCGDCGLNELMFGGGR